MRVLKDKVKRQQAREELYAKLDQVGVLPAEAIKQLRRILSLNQEDFAKKMGISLSALRRIEQKHSQYNISTLQKILDQFDLQLVVKLK